MQCRQLVGAPLHQRLHDRPARRPRPAELRRPCAPARPRRAREGRRRDRTPGRCRDRGRPVGPPGSARRLTGRQPAAARSASGSRDPADSSACSTSMAAEIRRCATTWCRCSNAARAVAETTPAASPAARAAGADAWQSKAARIAAEPAIGVVCRRHSRAVREPPGAPAWDRAGTSAQATIRGPSNRSAAGDALGAANSSAVATSKIAVIVATPRAPECRYRG